MNEELLAKGALKLTVPDSEASGPSKAGAIGAKESSLKRVLLVRDRRSGESWRFGFVEFSTAPDAQAALAAFSKMEKFTISSKPVTVSYIHPGVFVPVYNATKKAERFTFTALSSQVTPGLRLAYWDDDGFVSEYMISPPKEEGGEQDEVSTGAQKGPVGMDEKGKSKKRRLEKEAIGAGAPGGKKSVPAHLQFWQNRHSELHGIPAQTPGGAGGENNDSASGSDNGSGAAPSKQRKTEEKPEELHVQSFADLNKLACLLCSRQFKTAEKVYEHERVSALHLTNLKDSKLRETALKKLAKAGISVPSANPASNDALEYRDRAKERRQVFGKSSASQPPSSKKKKKEEPGAEPESVMPSKGAALMGKMGWTSGQGLGASGDGRTEHVIAEMYTQGVGLGMKGGKVGDVEEVAKGGGGYTDFVKRTKEKAKERYEGMQ